MATAASPCGMLRRMISKTERGAAAEALAADYLAARGLSIVARNLRCKAGELDLVCLDGEVLVIVEVRQRGRSDFGGALASVTWRKRRRLIRATQFHWQFRPAWRDRVLRFDVLALQGRPDGTYELAWIKDAFRAA
ncbi:MAG: putative endonuclease distantly related to archaeal Holliday junction resolvase [Gammaproteobacteria bacterium]|nr:putative endonuclease distantly related to archaeal Holliday junction resolvase [Gammaproteobacteria bacterium]